MGNKVTGGNLCYDAGYGEFKNLKVVKMRAIAVWLVHGSIGFVGSLFTGLAGSPLTHWWVEIETEDPDVWY